LLAWHTIEEAGHMSQDPTDGRLAEHLDWLAMECETGATWRRLQAELYPGDERNESSAVALDCAAGELRSASVAEYRQQLTSIAAVDRDQRFSLEKHYLIGRHGFGAGATATAGALVDAIADRARSAAARTR
jgi:hypothetical protein